MGWYCCRQGFDELETLLVKMSSDFERHGDERVTALCNCCIMCFHLVFCGLCRGVSDVAFWTDDSNIRDQRWLSPERDVGALLPHLVVVKVGLDGDPNAVSFRDVRNGALDRIMPVGVCDVRESITCERVVNEVDLGRAQSATSARVG